MKQLAIILTAIAAALALGQTPAPTTAPATGSATAPAQQVKMIKVTCLGLAATPIDAATAKELGLPSGMGLRVFVVPGSPAHKAGVKNNDVLTRFDDQLLVNLQQLTVLVRSQNVGKNVSLKIFREKEEKTLTVCLGQQEIPAVAPPASEPPSTDPRLPIDMYVANTRDEQHELRLVSVRGFKSLNVSDAKTTKLIFNGAVNTPADRAKLPEGVLAKLQKLEEGRSKLPLPDVVLPKDPPVFVPTDVIFNTPLYTMRLHVNKSLQDLEVKDKDGNIVFTGPVNTPEQVSALAPDWQQNLKAMRRSYQRMLTLSTTQTVK